MKAIVSVAELIFVLSFINSSVSLDIIAFEGPTSSVHHYHEVYCLAAKYSKLYAVARDELTMWQATQDCKHFYDGQIFQPGSNQEFVDVVKEYNLSTFEPHTNIAVAQDVFVNFQFDEDYEILHDNNYNEIRWNQGKNIPGCYDLHSGTCAAMSEAFGICTADCYIPTTVICESPNVDRVAISAECNAENSETVATASTIATATTTTMAATTAAAATIAMTTTTATTAITATTAMTATTATTATVAMAEKDVKDGIDENFAHHIVGVAVLFVLLVMAYWNALKIGRGLRKCICCRPRKRPNAPDDYVPLQSLNP